MVTEEDVAEMVVCGPSVDPHVEAIAKYEDAGFDHVYVHQVGPDQAASSTSTPREILPAFANADVGIRSTEPPRV